MSAAKRVAHAAETIRAAWERGVAESPQTEAAQALEDTGQLLDPAVAAELDRLRGDLRYQAWQTRAETAKARVAELEAERHSTNEALSDAAEQLRANRDRIAELEARIERRRARLVALENDALNMRGVLSPNGEARKVPMPLGETLTPVVEWLVARVAELEAAAYGDAKVRLFDPVGQIEHLHQALAAQMSRADTLDRLCREKRARVAELEAERHSTNEALEWARLMDAEDLADFLDELAASAITHASQAKALAEVERTCATWRLIAEAQHAHNAAPGPRSEERPVNALTATFMPLAMLREEPPGGEHYPAVHHEYRVSHDRPETGGASC